MATNRLSPRVRNSNQTSLFGLDVSQGVVSVAKQAKDYIGGVIDPSQRRRENAGLRKGAEKASKAVSTGKFADEDWRVRLSLPPNGLFYHDNTNTVLAPLKKTNGLLFPYTPQILLQHSANYSGANPVHSNYTQHFYSNSTVDAITITGDFTAQNPGEAAYIVAVVTFLRSVTKMFWGAKDELAGTPPPVMRLNGYGDYVFNNVPVVMSNFTFEMSPDVDYINTNIGSSGRGQRSTVERSDEDGGSWFEETTEPGPLSISSTRVPTKTTINVTLNPIYSRSRMNDFSLSDFAAGRLINRDNLTNIGGSGGSNKGGFI